MLRTLTCLAIVLWHAPLQKFAGASQLLQIMYHVSEVPSGMFWAAGNSEEVVARSALHCASKSLAKAGVGYTYLNGQCIVQGAGASSEHPFVGAQWFYKWNINRAFKRPVQGSTNTYSGSPVTHAVDERGCLTWSSSYTECCYVTYQTTGAWLVIDLGTPLRVHVVVIGSKKFFTDIEVRVGSELKTGNFATYKLLGKFASPTSSAGYVKFSKRQGIVGRYVSIQQNVYGNFFVCDVVVLADD